MAVIQKSLRLKMPSEVSSWYSRERQADLADADNMWVKGLSADDRGSRGPTKTVPTPPRPGAHPDSGD